jgi:hypothetical protein
MGPLSGSEQKSPLMERSRISTSRKHRQAGMDLPDWEQSGAGASCQANSIIIGQ